MLGRRELDGVSRHFLKALVDSVLYGDRLAVAISTLTHRSRDCDDVQRGRGVCAADGRARIIRKAFYTVSSQYTDCS